MTEEDLYYKYTTLSTFEKTLKNGVRFADVAYFQENEGPWADDFDAVYPWRTKERLKEISDILSNAVNTKSTGSEGSQDNSPGWKTYIFSVSSVAPKCAESSQLKNDYGNSEPLVLELDGGKINSNLDCFKCQKWVQENEPVICHSGPVSYLDVQCHHCYDIYLKKKCDRCQGKFAINLHESKIRSEYDNGIGNFPSGKASLWIAFRKRKGTRDEASKYEREKEYRFAFTMIDHREFVYFNAKNWIVKIYCKQNMRCEAEGLVTKYGLESKVCILDE